MSRDASIAGAIDDVRARELARETLARGGVVVLPTDTLFGFSARLSAEDAVRRISAAKRAPNDRRYILLASSVEMAGRFVRSFGCASRDTLSTMWPAPLSVILPAGPACPAWVGPTVAIRVPALETLRDVDRGAGRADRFHQRQSRGRGTARRRARDPARVRRRSGPDRAGRHARPRSVDAGGSVRELAARGAARALCLAGGRRRRKSLEVVVLVGLAVGA